MFPHCSHITRKRGIYHFRRRLPAPYLGEKTLSLRTKSYREAEHLAKVLDFDHDIISGLLSDARERLTRRETHHVAEEVDGLIQHFDLPEDCRSELAIGLLRVHVKSLESALQRVQEGVHVDFELSGPVCPPIEGPGEKPSSSHLFNAWPPFVSFMVTEEGWRGQTERQNAATYRTFVECCGDRPVNEYSRQDCAKFFDLPRGLPALYSKRKELSLQEIVQATDGQDVERLSMKTIRRHFSALGRLFDHFKRRGDFQGENPALMAAGARDRVLKGTIFVPFGIDRGRRAQSGSNRHSDTVHCHEFTDTYARNSSFRLRRNRSWLT